VRGFPDRHLADLAQSWVRAFPRGTCGMPLMLSAPRWTRLGYPYQEFPHALVRRRQKRHPVLPGKVHGLFMSGRSLVFPGEPQKCGKLSGHFPRVHGFSSVAEHTHVLLKTIRDREQKGSAEGDCCPPLWAFMSLHPLLVQVACRYQQDSGEVMRVSSCSAGIAQPT
jgi:hypothetical protein